MKITKMHLLLLGLLPIILVILSFSVALNGFPMGDIGAHSFEIVSIVDYGYLQSVPEMELGEYRAGIYYFPLSWWVAAIVYFVFSLLGFVNAITLATYGLIILIFLAMIWVSKKFFDSWFIGIGFVSLAFFNSIAINTLIESTRFGAIFAYFIFIVFLFKLAKIVDKQEAISLKDFTVLSILLSLITMSYVNVGLAAGVLLLGFMLIYKETWKWVWVPFLAFLPNLIWLYPYYEAFQEGISIASDSYAVTTVPLLFIGAMGLFLFLLIFLLTQERNGNVFKLLLTQIVFYGFIYILKGILIVPVFFLDRFIFALHLVNLIIISSFFLFRFVHKINFNLKSTLTLILLGLVVLSAGVSAIKHNDLLGELDYSKTPCFEANEIIPDLNDPFISRITSDCRVSIESYIYVYFGNTNFLGPVGYAVSGEHQIVKNNLDEFFDSGSCEDIIGEMNRVGINSILCEGTECEKLSCLKTISKVGEFEVKQ